MTDHIKRQYEKIKRQFGGVVPQYLKDLFAMKIRNAEEREQQNARYEQEKQAAFKRRQALRRPPRNVRMVGRTIEWDPPTTVHERKPNYYIVSEQMPNGKWTILANHVRHLSNTTRYKSPLIYGIAAKVESDYGDEGLGVHFYSETVYPVDFPEPLVKPKPHPEKDQNNSGVDQAPQPENEPQKDPKHWVNEPDRNKRVIASLDSYEGRFTRVRKVPVLSDLQKHSGILNLTRKERNRLFREWKSMRER